MINTLKLLGVNLYETINIEDLFIKIIYFSRTIINTINISDIFSRVIDKIIYFYNLIRVRETKSTWGYIQISISKFAYWFNGSKKYIIRLLGSKDKDNYKDGQA